MITLLGATDVSLVDGAGLSDALPPSGHVPSYEREQPHADSYMTEYQEADSGSEQDWI